MGDTQLQVSHVVVTGSLMACSACCPPKKLTWDKLVMPNTKQMESRMLDLPLPLRPVMALKYLSKPGTVTR